MTNPTNQPSYQDEAISTEKIIQVSKQVGLRVITFEPAVPGRYMPIVLVSGLSTVIESFEKVLKELARDFIVHYVETREKPSSQISGTVGFDIKLPIH